MRIVADGKSTNGFEVIDPLGTIIDNVVSFDTDTGELEVLILGTNRMTGGKNLIVSPNIGNSEYAFKPVIAKAKVPGAKLVTK